MDPFWALAFPLVLATLVLESWVARRRGRDTYRFEESIANLGGSTLFRLGSALLFPLGLALYAGLHRHRFLDLPASSAITWIVAFVGVDLAHYCWHRLSHTVNFLWAMHGVHHQSEDLNFAAALRNFALDGIVRRAFQLPLALLGVPPVAVIAMDVLSVAYQIFVHTEQVDRLGPLEGVLNTPSSHRVHHGVNPRYLDKNYGGILALWDRLFGSYEPESERPVYGIVEPLRSFDPVRAQFHFFAETARIARAAPVFADKLLIWMKPPSWRPRGLPPCPPPPEVQATTFRKHEVTITPGVRHYLTCSGAIAIVLSSFVYDAPPALAAALAVLLVLSVAGWGALIDGRGYAMPVEMIRLALLGAVAAIAVPLPQMQWIGPAAAFGLACWLTRIAPLRGSLRTLRTTWRRLPACAPSSTDGQGPTVAV